MTHLKKLLACCLPAEAVKNIHEQMYVHPSLQQAASGIVTRAELAQALNMALFHGLVQRVPAGQDYIASDVVAQKRQVVFDHGALRTVRWASGALPAGEAAFTRVLRPLGFELQGTYPLPRLKMTGRAYSHRDFPEDIAQFFVSELHPEQFSTPFQSAVTRVLSTSRDPLGPQDVADLEQLTRDGMLPLALALRLLPQLLQCFDRQHGVFGMDDYELLLAESAEMAWIATEGNAFNHATDRVSDVDAVAERQRALGRPIKDKVEVSASGRVRQTAFRAATVQREFITAQGRVTRDVPGSFYEFITRDALIPIAANDPVQAPRLDLAFDAGNATGIFGMTAARA
ncbi:2-oxoadipate dioxygenase/decarboxylase family protein [Polaromonas sp. P5_D5]